MIGLIHGLFSLKPSLSYLILFSKEQSALFLLKKYNTKSGDHDWLGRADEFPFSVRLAVELVM